MEGNDWDVDGADRGMELDVLDRSLLFSGRCAFADGERIIPREGEPLDARDNGLRVAFVEDECGGDLDRSGKGRSREADDTVRSRAVGGGGDGGVDTVERVMKVSNRRDEMTCSRLRCDNADDDVLAVATVYGSKREVAFEEERPLIVEGK